MIQSPGGGSACHGVSLFIWSECELKNDCDAKEEEIKKNNNKTGALWLLLSSPPTVALPLWEADTF